MASLVTQLEVLMITFSMLVFALVTLTGMLNEECACSTGMTTDTHELVIAVFTLVYNRGGKKLNYP